MALEVHPHSVTQSLLPRDPPPHSSLRQGDPYQPSQGLDSCHPLQGSPYLPSGYQHPYHPPHTQDPSPLPHSCYSLSGASVDQAPSDPPPLLGLSSEVIHDLQNEPLAAALLAPGPTYSHSDKHSDSHTNTPHEAPQTLPNHSLPPSDPCLGSASRPSHSLRRDPDPQSGAIEELHYPPSHHPHYRLQTQDESQTSLLLDFASQNTHQDVCKDDNTLMTTLDGHQAPKDPPEVAAELYKMSDRAPTLEST